MATAGGIGNALAAAVDGWMRGKKILQQQEEYESDRDWKSRERDRKQQEWAAQDAEMDMRKSAGAPRVVQEVLDGEGTVAAMKAAEQGPPAVEMPIDFSAAPKYLVAQQSTDGKTPMKFGNVAQMYGTQEAANTAAQLANTPQNMAQRMSEGYMRLGNHEKAMQIATNQLSLEKLQEEAIERQRAREFGEGSVTGFPGLIGVANKYGMNLRHEVGEDGKVRILRVGKDGELTKTPFEFTNDEEGILQAMVMLDGRISPKDRLNQMLKEREAAQRQANADRTHNLAVRGADRADRAQDRADRTADRQDRLTDAQIDNYGRKAEAAAAEAKIPPAVKMLVQSGQKQLETINTQIAKAMADGSWDPNSDGAKALLAQQKALNNQVNGALLPYRIQGGGDAFGVRSKVGSPAPAGGRVTPMAGVRGDVQSSGYAGGSRAAANAETLAILQRELQQPGITDQDKAAIQREMQRLVQQGAAVPTAMALVQPPAPAPTAAAPAAKPVNMATRSPAAPAAKAAPRDFYSGETAAKRHAEREKREAEEKKKDEEKRKRREAERDQWAKNIEQTKRLRSQKNGEPA